MTASKVRELDFTTAGSPRLVMEKVFALLAPGRTLPSAPKYETDRYYNWGADESYYTPEGDGLRVAERCYGAVAGDGIEYNFHLEVGQEIGIHTMLADYAQDSYTFRISATAEAIDVATDALLQAAAACGLLLKQRRDVPSG